MDNSPQNFDEFKKKTKKRRLNELKAQMDGLRDELKTLRNSVFNEDDAYQNLVNDDEYGVLRKEGDFTKNDEDINYKRIYPSYQESEEKRKIRRIAEKSEAKNYKRDYKSTVYIKEFKENPEVVKAQISSMKKGAPQVSAFPKIPTDLPITKRDLERYIGENLVSKLAVLVIFITLVLAYRYAIAMGYVPKPVRIGIGVTFGLGLIGTAYYLLSKKNTMSSTLVLLGAAVLYYTTYLAYYDYGYLNQALAFVANLTITLTITIAALLYNRMGLAIISVIGGYATPFVANQGGGNYIFFFSYVFLINLAMVIIAYKKDWRAINLFSYLATLVFLFGWTIAQYGKIEPSEYVWIFVFSSLFYFVYFVNDIVYNIKPHITFLTIDAYIMMSYTFFYALGVWFIAEGLSLTADYKYFLAVMGVFNLFYTLMIYRRDNVDDELEEIVLGKAALFITLGGWLIFREYHINTFWGILSVVFLIFGLKLDNKLLKSASVVMIILGVVTMLTDWLSVYYIDEKADFFVLNPAFAAGIVTSLTIAATLFIFYFYKKNTDILFLPKETYTQTLGSLLIFTSFFSGLFELMFHTRTLAWGTDFRVLLIGAYNMVYILALRFVVKYFKISRLQRFTDTMMALAVVSYLIYGHFSVISLRDDFLLLERHFFSFGFHYFNVALSILLVYLLIRDIVASEGYASGKYSVVMWIMCIMVVTHATFELEHTIVLLRSGVFESSIESSLDQIRLTGYSILWTLIAFAFMYIGMKNKIKEIRLISLVLLAFTLLKFFLFDFWKLNPIWKICATLIIGFLLLIVSNMYKQLKTLLEKGELTLDKDQILSQNDHYFDIMSIFKKNNED